MSESCMSVSSLPDRLPRKEEIGPLKESFFTENTELNLNVDDSFGTIVQENQFKRKNINTKKVG